MADLRVLVVAADDERPELQIVGQVSGDEPLVEELDIFQPDALVFDLGWEPEGGLAGLEELALDPEDERLVVIVLMPDEETAAAAWAAGARGLLLRTTSGERIVAAIQSVAQGLAVIEPDLLAGAWPAAAPEAPELAEELTPRELEVLQLLAEGLANKAIAQRLAISEHTVKFHVNAIMSKLGAQSRTAAVVQATRLGLIML
jgi:DNA-binding NarL/FixJ family response regulator